MELALLSPPFKMILTVNAPGNTANGASLAWYFFTASLAIKQ
jgi:hypothetical protein